MGGARRGPGAWWRAGKSAYVPQRPGDEGRAAAVRALVLYPMNALVEDQLVRLRTALDSTVARTRGSTSTDPVTGSTSADTPAGHPSQARV